MAENDFLKELLDTFTQRMDRIEGKVDKNTDLTQQALSESRATNGAVGILEGRVKKLETKKGEKLDLSPNVIYLIALGGVILLIIVASILGVNLGGLVK